MLHNFNDCYRHIALYVQHGKIHNFSCSAFMPHYAFLYDGLWT